MKKIISILIILSLILTCMINTSLVLADQIETVPTILERIAHDDFINNSGNTMLFTANEAFPDLGVYNGGTGFTGTWKRNVALDQDLIYTGISAGTASKAFVDHSFFINTNGEFAIRCNTDTAFRQLSSSVDLNVDAEYYLVYTYESKSVYDYKQYLTLGNAAFPELITFGEKQNKPNPHRSVIAALADKSTNRMMSHNTKVTALLHISARSATSDICKFRAFLHNDTETPSFTPSSWDMEFRLNSSENLNLIGLKYYNQGNYTQSTTEFKTDEISIYKGTPVVVSKFNTNSEEGFSADGQPFTTSGDQLSVSIAAQNILGNNQQLLSREWLDYTDSENLVVLSTDSTYTVPESMVNKLIKLKIVVKDMTTNEETTLYPFQQYISDKYSINIAVFSVGNSDPERLRTPPTTSTKKIGYYAEIKRTNTVASDRMTGDKAVIYLAQYNQEGRLKRVVSKTYSLDINPNVIVPTLTTNTDYIKVTDLVFEDGDYLKGFVWIQGNIKPISFDNNYNQSPFFNVNDTRQQLN